MFLLGVIFVIYNQRFVLQLQLLCGIVCTTCHKCVLVTFVLCCVDETKTVVEDVQNIKYPYHGKNDETDSDTDVDLDYYKSQNKTENNVSCHKPTRSPKDKCTRDNSSAFSSRKFVMQNKATYREALQACCECGKKFTSYTRLKAHKLACTEAGEQLSVSRTSRQSSSPG